MAKAKSKTAPVKLLPHERESAVDVSTARSWSACLFRLGLGLLAILLVWGVGVGLRLVELPRWDCGYCQVAGQKLLATHDAYFWLAGAEGFGWGAERPFSRFVRLFHVVTGVEYPLLGFWLAALLAPLAAVPLGFWAFRKEIPEAALPIGVLATGCSGFLQRTRLGYLDDDPLTLFFSAALGVALSCWLIPQVRAGWWPDRAPPVPQRPFRPWLGAVGLGLLFRAYMGFYAAAFPIAVSMSLGAAGLGLLLALPGGRSTVFSGSLLLLLVGLGGWSGLLAAGGLLALSWFRPRLAGSWRGTAIVLGGFLAVLLLTGQFFGLPWRMLRSVLVYAKIVEPFRPDAAGIVFPGAVESIREAARVPFAAVVNLTAGHWAVFIPALLGYGWLVWKQPAALVFAPLLGLALASMKLGARFTMYGGVPLGLGFGFAAVYLLDRLRLRAAWLRWIAVLGLTLLAIYPTYTTATKLRPAPVLSPPLAEALLQLKEVVEPEAWLWLWWDYGYAAQYYAQRHTFADGGSQHGPGLYSLALVHATDSPLQARQMMLTMAHSFAAQEQVQRWQADSLGLDLPVHRLYPYPIDRGLPFADMTPAMAREFVEALGDRPLPWPGDLPPQYLVVAWDTFSLANWISNFGTQNLETGARDPGHLKDLPMEFEVKGEGFLELPDITLPLSSFTLIQERQRSFFEWPHQAPAREAHLVIFEHLNHASYLMDKTMRESMMIRLLIDDPATVAEHFELLLDNFPWVRVYRVKGEE